MQAPSSMSDDTQREFDIELRVSTVALAVPCWTPTGLECSSACPPGV